MHASTKRVSLVHNKYLTGYYAMNLCRDTIFQSVKEITNRVRLTSFRVRLANLVQRNLINDSMVIINVELEC